MVCTPGEVHACEILDIGGGRAAMLTLMGSTESLTIATSDLISFSDYNPYDFLVYPGEALQLDGLAERVRRPELSPYLHREAPEATVDAFAHEMVGAAGGETLPFLILLSERLNREFDYAVRETGVAQSPPQTLAQGRGACRDFAVLYMDVCRAAGVPARFVSGYHADTSSEDAVHMHAWVEVYIPGAGWRGFDPTNGIAATNRYIATAAAVSPDDAAPITGTFRGDGAVTELRTDVQMTEVD